MTARAQLAKKKVVVSVEGLGAKTKLLTVNGQS
jgi:hypothetical protein